MRWNKVAALLALVLGGSSTVGCGDGTTPPTTSLNQGGSGGAGGEGGGGGTAGSGGGDTCNHGCAAFGVTQCSGDTIQSCAPDADGCRQWISLLDCAANGSVCDDSVMPVACVAPTCSDAMKNQDETDVDCGGTKCNKCDYGKACIQDSDCTSNLCDSMSNTCTCQPLSLTEQDASALAPAVAAFNAGEKDGDFTTRYIESVRLYTIATCLQQPATLQAVVEALDFNFAFGHLETTAEIQAHPLFTTSWSTGGPGLAQSVVQNVSTTMPEGWSASWPGQADDKYGSLVLWYPDGKVLELSTYTAYD